jgi:hydrogenase nickel incorporation protein HypA/HybF
MEKEQTMHEVAAMQSAVRTVLESLQKAGGKRVTNVQLILGASAHFTADAAYQLFEALVIGTPAERASLTIEWLPAVYQCFSCLHSFASSEPSAQVACPRCGEPALEIAHQDICTVSAIDVTCDEENEKVNELLLPPVESWNSKSCA